MADIPINAIDRRVQFTNNTGTGPFSFTFNILADSDIAVYKNDTLLTLTTDYTITTAANGTGSVTLTGSGNGTALVTSDFLTIVGGRALSRTTDFVTAGDLLASALNEQLDSNVIMVQQLDEKIERTLRIDQSDQTADMVLPKKADRANKTLGFDANGLPAVGEEIGDYKGDWAASTTYAIRDLVKDTSTNNIFRANTAHTSSGSQPLTTNTDSAKWDLIVDAASATTSATNAATSATNAATSATNAATSATNAATSATSASTAQTAAEAAKTAAETAQAAAETAADNFDDTYLGSKASDPSVDNDGDALNAGDLYFNTDSNTLKVYTGSAWQDAALTAGDFIATTGGTLTGNLNFNDGIKAQFGTDNDFEVFHNGSNTILQNTGTGEVYIGASGTQIWDETFGEACAKFFSDSDVELYHDGSKKFETSSTGVTVTGTAVATTNTDTTNTGSITLDFGANQNFVLTLTGNVTLANPSTEQVGQSGFIAFIQDSTGGRTLSLGTDYETAGGAGITLSTAASTTDLVPYVVVASNRILLGAPQLAFS